MDLSKFSLIGIADEIGDLIWNAVKNWNSFLKDTIGKQLVNAADSISANLAEGYGRYTIPERIRFCYFSRGSLCESINWIQKADRRGLIEPILAKKIIGDLNTLSIKINKYIRSLRSNNFK